MMTLFIEIPFKYFLFDHQIELHKTLITTNIYYDALLFHSVT